jgi:ceramide glucosyltransferase
MVLLGVLQFRASQRKARHSAPENAHLPPVSVLKPVHGLEARLRENLESFFHQDYPAYEVLFAADTENDPALDVVREVCARYPHIPSRILVTGPRPWPNPPAYAFHCMAEVATHDFLVTSDSDVEVSPSYLREVVPPLLDPQVGMVTCVYRGKNARGFWSGLTALGMSIEMTAGVLVANLLEGMRFGLGPTIAVRKDSLARIGGFGATGSYFANDFIIGKLMHQAGYRVVLSSHVIDHVVAQITFQHMWQNQARWARSTRRSRPLGHLGSGLVFAMPYGLAGFIAAGLLGSWTLGAAMLIVALLNRFVETWAVGWWVVRDPRARQAPWLYPLRDLLGFFVWCSSYLSTRMVWRNHPYEVTGEQWVLPQTPAGGTEVS